MNTRISSSSTTVSKQPGTRRNVFFDGPFAGSGPSRVRSCPLRSAAHYPFAANDRARRDRQHTDERMPPPPPTTPTRHKTQAHNMTT